jgi:serine/threonine protein kinase
MHKDLIPTDVRLEDSVLSLEGEDKRLFLDFIKKMLQWLPEDRKTAKELLEDPWLQENST